MKPYCFQHQMYKELRFLDRDRAVYSCPKCEELQYAQMMEVYNPLKHYNPDEWK